MACSCLGPSLAANHFFGPCRTPSNMAARREQTFVVNAICAHENKLFQSISLTVAGLNKLTEPGRNKRPEPTTYHFYVNAYKLSCQMQTRQRMMQRNF